MNFRVDYDSEPIQAQPVSGKILDFFSFSHSTSNAHNSVNIGPLSLKIAPEIGIDLLFLDFDLDLFEQQNARKLNFRGIVGNGSCLD